MFSCFLYLLLKYYILRGASMGVLGGCTADNFSKRVEVPFICQKGCFSRIEKVVVRQGASLWEVCGVRYPPGLRSCRQISKISAVVGNSRIAGGIKVASIFMPIVQTVLQLRKLLIYHSIEYTVHSYESI